jgi:hypothetical protein
MKFLLCLGYPSAKRFATCEPKQILFLRDVLGKDVDFEDNLEDLRDPVREENNGKASQRAGNHFLAFFLGFFIGCACEHSESTHDEHAKKNNSRELKNGGKEAVGDATKTTAGCQI